ncbi:MAG TPA: serine--tRNA ligase [Hyphomicrobiales bacterium]|nr:serine--tRNA ligase [Hyphomicrobiales bacterium]
MLDLKLIRDNPDAFDAAIAKRGLTPLSAEILAIDEERRKVITALQEAQSRRNQISKEVGKAKAAKKETQAQKLIAEMGDLKEAIQTGEQEEKEISAKLDELLAGLPNLPADEVPVGDEDANKEIRRWGKPPKFDFEPKQHFELGEALGQMDFETAAKMSGSRFVVLRGELARMERALAAFMLDLQTREHGYEEVSPPLLVRDAALFGTGQLPKFGNDLFFTYAFPLAPGELDEITDETGFPHDYELKDQLAYIYDLAARNRRGLIPTAEVTLTNLVREDTLDEASLPYRFTAHTPCFRSEAGAAGKDTRGMIRMHQFSKVEMVSITTPDQSEDEHERMTNCAEEVLKRLGLAYRTLILASRDMGFGARKTYDLEVWLPGQDTYREISSCSNCGDFQARRMNTRYRPKDSKQLQFVHTLNGSGLAVGRTLVAVLENYQQKDGSIRVPEALIPYMGGQEIIGAAK